MASKGQQTGEGVEALATTTENQIAPVQSMDAVEWVDTIKEQTKGCMTRLLDSLYENADQIPPERMAGAARDMWNIHKEADSWNQANLNVTVGINLDGDDLSHGDLVSIISGLSPSKSKSPGPKTKRVNEIQSQDDSENESQQEATNKQWDARDSQVIDIKQEAKEGSLDQSAKDAESIGEDAS